MNSYKELNEAGVLLSRFEEGLEWLIKTERKIDYYESFRDNVVIPLFRAWDRLDQESKKKVLEGDDMSVEEIKQMLDRVGIKYKEVKNVGR